MTEVTEEQKNFYRHSTVIVDHTKKSLTKFLEHYLNMKNTHGITLRKFIFQNRHKIYHMFDNKYPCCQCPAGTPPHRKGKSIFSKAQMDVLFERSSTVARNHTEYCCSDVKFDLHYEHLDVTLASMLLLNLCTIVQRGSAVWSAITFLREKRNTSYGHVSEGSMSTDEFETSMNDIEKELLVLAKVYGKEKETKRELDDVRQQPFDNQSYQDLKNTLLQMSKTIEIFNESSAKNNSKLMGEIGVLNKKIEQLNITINAKNTSPALGNYRANGIIRQPLLYDELFYDVERSNETIENQTVKEICRQFESKIKNSLRADQEKLYKKESLQRQASAEIEVESPNYDEHEMASNIMKNEQLKTATKERFSIRDCWQKCIILDLSFTAEVLKSETVLRSAISSFIDDIIGAGNIDAKEPGQINISLNFKDQLNKDEMRILQSVFSESTESDIERQTTNTNEQKPGPHADLSKTFAVKCIFCKSKFECDLCKQKCEFIDHLRDENGRLQTELAAVKLKIKWNLKSKDYLDDRSSGYCEMKDEDFDN